MFRLFFSLTMFIYTVLFIACSSKSNNRRHLPLSRFLALCLSFRHYSVKKLHEATNYHEPIQTKVLCLHTLHVYVYAKGLYVLYTYNVDTHNIYIFTLCFSHSMIHKTKNQEKTKQNTIYARADTARHSRQKGKSVHLPHLLHVLRYIHTIVYMLLPYL